MSSSTHSTTSNAALARYRFAIIGANGKAAYPANNASAVAGVTMDSTDAADKSIGLDVGPIVEVEVGTAMDASNTLEVGTDASGLAKEATNKVGYWLCWKGKTTAAVGDRIRVRLTA